MSNIGVWEDAEPGVKRCILRAEDSLMMEVHFAKGPETRSISPRNAKHGVTVLEDNSALLDVFTPIREDLVKK